MASVSTHDHDEIRRWAYERSATPAVLDRVSGMLRFEFDQPPGLDNISWEDFFRIFDERGLEMVYDDKPASRFHKLIYPEGKDPAKPARKPRARVQPIRPSRRGSAGPARARGRSTAAGRQSGGSESGRTTGRSSKGHKPAGKPTRKAASQRPSPPRRAA